jgi:8-amino-7-oxononanoate synthase
MADRLIHASMIAGLQRSGARIHRYPHLDLGRLEVALRRESRPRSGGGRPANFVVTESVFSMDGDYPDLGRLAELKRRFGFFWVLDEAHALGWYGPEGAGLARAAGVEGAVDVLVGTLGKTLGSGGAYTLFRDESVRDYLVNFAGEFIYSTALPPANAAAALAALDRVRSLAAGQAEWHASSRAFRAALRADGWAVPEGESPVVPLRLDDEDEALALAGVLRAAGILAGAVRPPTVPPGTSRLRFSLKRTFGAADIDRVLSAIRPRRPGKEGR